jgi:hypothetical protein
MPRGIRRWIPAEDHPSTTDIHWMAGIYEGEGTAYPAKGATGVHVSQKDPWILYKMQRFVGGSVTPRIRCRVDGTKEFFIHRLILSGARARGFLYTVYPLLSPRRQAQARWAMGLSPKE